jgi:hypothetical protein
VELAGLQSTACLGVNGAGENFRQGNVGVVVCYQVVTLHDGESGVVQAINVERGNSWSLLCEGKLGR